MPTNTPNLNLIKPLVSEKYTVAVANANNDILDTAVGDMYSKSEVDGLLTALAGSYLTGNQTITLSGDVSGSGTTAITVTVADDSHNHIISNVDGLQTALDGKAPLASPTFTGTPTISGSGRVISNDTAAGTSVFEIWSGTQAQYDAIGTKDANTLYFIG